jgi:CBS domain-containing protein
MVEIPIPTAEDCMTKKFLSVRPDADLLEAIGKMADASVAGAAVLDHEGGLRGILTEKDCLRILTMSTYHEARAGRVADLMSPVPECPSPGMGLFTVANLFLETHFPLLPVMDEGRVVGVISRQLILKVIQKTAKKLEGEYRKKHRIEKESEEVTNRPRSIEDMQDVYSKSTREQLLRRVKRKG